MFSSFLSVYTTHRCQGIGKIIWITHRDTDTTDNLPWPMVSRMQGSLRRRHKTEHGQKMLKHRNTQSSRTVEQFFSRENPTAERVPNLGPFDQKPTTLPLRQATGCISRYNYLTAWLMEPGGLMPHSQELFSNL